MRKAVAMMYRKAVVVVSKFREFRQTQNLIRGIVWVFIIAKGGADIAAAQNRSGHEN